MRANAIIERILKENRPDAVSGVCPRDSDNELYIQVFESFGLYMSESQKDKFRNLPFALASVRRIRQKFNESGLYKAQDRIRRHREFKGMEVRQKMPQTSPEKVQPLLENRDHQEGQTKLV